MPSPAAAMRLLRAHTVRPRRASDAVSRWLRNHHPTANPKPAEFAMYDSVTISEIPADAPAVAGYVNGRYRTFPKLVKAFPHAKRLSIAVTAAADARCLDVERYDATPEQAAAWVRRQHARGIKRPVIYCSVSAVASVTAGLDKAKIRWRPRSVRTLFRAPQVEFWTAHYTHTPHRCSPGCYPTMPLVAAATQWTDRSHGRNLDESLCHPSFL